MTRPRSSKRRAPIRFFCKPASFLPMEVEWPCPGILRPPKRRIHHRNNPNHTPREPCASNKAASNEKQSILSSPSGLSSPDPSRRMRIFWDHRLPAAFRLHPSL